MGDRYCVSRRVDHRKLELLSPAQLAACTSSGESLYETWEYVGQHGLITDECYGTQMGCTDHCVGLHIFHPVKFGSVESLLSVPGMMTLLLSTGPVSATINITASYSSYSGGIYSCGANEPVIGDTSVRVLGWASVNGTANYWIAAASYGTEFGVDGIVYLSIADCPMTGIACMF